MRKPEKQPHLRIPIQPGRCSLADKTVRSIVIAVAIAVGGIVELSQPKTKEYQQITPIFTEDEFIYLVQRELGYMTICHSCLDTDASFNKSDEENLHPFIMTRAAISKLWIESHRLFEEPSEAIEDVTDTTRESVEYVVNYQQSEEELGRQNIKDPDCNDNAYSACQKLDRYGIPMYLISIWTRKPKERFDTDKPWHQMAACRIGRNRFFIIDNSRAATIWEGSLRSFVARYNTNVPVSIIPAFGITKFTEPKYNTGPTKLMTHAFRTAEENEMEIVQITDNSIQLAQR